MDDNKPDAELPVEQVPEERGDQEVEGQEEEKEVEKGEEGAGEQEEKEEGKEKEVGEEKEENVEEAEVEIEKEQDGEEVVAKVEENEGMSTAEATKDRPNSSAEEEDEQRVPVEEPEIGVTTIPAMSGTPPREQRAKKAQRTKRAAVSSTQNANPKSTKQKVTSTATSNDQSGDVPDGSDEEVEEGEGGDEVAKVIQAVVGTMEKVLRLVLCCFGFICRLLMGIFGAVRRGLGVLFGAGLFAGVAYVIGTYVMTPVSEYDVMGFEARLKHLLRYQVWPTLPVFLAAVAGMVRRDNDVHRTYGRECFEQALMSLFNLLLLATHLEPSCVLWAGACVITATVFSLLHWFCLVYTKRRGSVFSLPGYLLNFVVMAYNLYTIFGQNLGYVPMATEPEVRMTTGSQGGAISYWNHVTMCHLVEQMFCKP